MGAITLPSPLTWADRAACQGQDLDAFFTESAAGVAAAKQICRSCPVRQLCLAEALRAEDGSRYGIYGGLTPDERTELAGKEPRGTGRKLAPCGTPSAYERHVKRREPIDPACRAAKREADRRRRRTAGMKPRT